MWVLHETYLDCFHIWPNVLPNTPRNEGRFKWALFFLPEALAEEPQGTRPSRQADGVELGGRQAGEFFIRVWKKLDPGVAARRPQRQRERETEVPPCSINHILFCTFISNTRMYTSRELRAKDGHFFSPQEEKLLDLCFLIRNNLDLDLFFQMIYLFVNSSHFTSSQS